MFRFYNLRVDSNLCQTLSILLNSVPTEAKNLSKDIISDNISPHPPPTGPGQAGGPAQQGPGARGRRGFLLSAPQSPGRTNGGAEDWTAVRTASLRWKETATELSVWRSRWVCDVYCQVSSLLNRISRFAILSRQHFHFTECLGWVSAFCVSLICRRKSAGL